MKRLAIVSTHPVQYNAPIFRSLASYGKLDVKVFYTWEQSKEAVFDPGFGKVITWDIPLLDGYAYEFSKNKSGTKKSKSFWSIQNPTLIQDIKTYNADAILVIGWNYASHLQVMRYFKGRVPVFFRGDSTLLNERKGWRQLIRRFLLTQIYKYVDIVLYVGSANKAYYLKHGLKESQLVYAPHAIDNARFGTESVEAIAWAAGTRDKLGIPAEAKVFLFAGKLEPVKNPELLLSAFTCLTDKEPHLIIVGNGKLEGNLKAKYKKYPNIHFIDFQNQSLMPAVYRMADVFVLGSDSETWGLAVNEAMACGRAVLVSDKVGCAADLVQVGRNGFIFKAGDKEDLLNKLNELRNYPKATLTEMGRASAEIIKNWNYTIICNAILDKLGD